MKYCRSRSSAMKKGRPYYKTGLPCSRGHVSHRYTINGRCYECNKINTNTRYDSIKTRTPPWANLIKIKDIYKRCKEMGEDYHVDHIIPLHGEFVSGLHVPENLRIIHKVPNLLKGNLFVEDLL